MARRVFFVLMSMSNEFVSFPEGELGERSHRLTVLARGGDWYALEKPAGVAAVRDARGGKRSLVESLASGIESGRAQFRRAGIEAAHAVAYPDPDVSGVFLAAGTQSARTLMRNAMGAAAYTFIYRLVTPGETDAGEFVCDLPLVRPDKARRMQVSHAAGKKTVTRFRAIGRSGRYFLWETESHYNRQDQVRLHAFESGLPVVGDGLYAGSGPVFLSSWKRNYRPKGKERPLYSHPCLHLARIRFPDPATGDPAEVACPLPSRLNAFLAQAERYS